MNSNPAHRVGLPDPPASPCPPRTAVTLATLRRMARAAEPFACLTCYDATSARWLARAGVHLLLVGDTAAEVVLGFSRTIDMPLDVLIALTAGVKRGSGDACVVMGDMPFLSYHADEASAIRNAGRFLTDGLADIVKIEADASFAPLVEKMVRAGIPVCGHVGSRPQRAAVTSGYVAAGRTADDAAKIIRDAVALQDAGCSMLLIEAVPEQVTRAVLDRITCPLIGIGAGGDCHGQVLVLQDVAGLSDETPAFVHPLGRLGEALSTCAAAWVTLVRERRIGASPYSMREGESEKLAQSPPHTR